MGPFNRLFTFNPTTSPNDWFPAVRHRLREWLGEIVPVLVLAFGLDRLAATLRLRPGRCNLASTGRIRIIQVIRIASSLWQIMLIVIVIF